MNFFFKGIQIQLMLKSNFSYFYLVYVFPSHKAFSTRAETPFVVRLSEFVAGSGIMIPYALSLTFYDQWLQQEVVGTTSPKLLTDGFRMWFKVNSRFIKWTLSYTHS